MNRFQVDSHKRARFFLGVLLILVCLTAFSYVRFSFDGIFNRYDDSLNGTEWMSWAGNTLSFDEGVASYLDGDDRGDYPYEERAGVVELLKGGDVYRVFVRFSSQRLVTSDGKEVFYLKTGDSMTEEESDEQAEMD